MVPRRHQSSSSHRLIPDLAGARCHLLHEGDSGARRARRQPCWHPESGDPRVRPVSVGLNPPVLDPGEVFHDQVLSVLGACPLRAGHQRRCVAGGSHSAKKRLLPSEPERIVRRAGFMSVNHSRRRDADHDASDLFDGKCVCAKVVPIVSGDITARCSRGRPCWSSGCGITRVVGRPFFELRCRAAGDHVRPGGRAWSSDR